ncbi:response regulator transcription factor [Acetatifactor muris]|uniref:response regulator transcription factor n=1 Tax=Acetatifactor muris TaxID=879566 RepID=UPI0023F15EBB|nr:response regulator [Acetatifactor muris]MCI8798339.1 response regulator [Lachnospiraceae bacterium]
MGEKIKLLLVDDESFLCEQICSNINWDSFGVELIGSCENAMDALEQMIDEMPDILITDIKMPVMTGLELIARARQMNPALQCVILSGYGEFTLAQAAIEQGVQSYLLKPFSKAEFESTLGKCCELVERERSGKSMELKERTENVSRLFQDLRGLKENNAAVEPEQIQKIMLTYPDLVMLREAMVLASVYEDGRSEFGKKWIPRFYEEGDILKTAAEALNDMLPKKEKESQLVRKIKAYVQQHYMDETLNLQLIAEQVVHLGVKYIGRCFYRETEVKFSQYLLEIRMEKAKKMLKDTEDNKIEEIAEAIGLGHDVPYFYQLFKRYTGMTPKEYKKV